MYFNLEICKFLLHDGINEISDDSAVSVVNSEF